MSELGAVFARLASLAAVGAQRFYGSTEAVVAFVVGTVVVFALAFIWTYFCYGVCIISIGYQKTTTGTRQTIQQSVQHHGHGVGRDYRHLRTDQQQQSPQVTSRPLQLDHPRFQPTFLSALAHSSSTEFHQSLATQEQSSNSPPPSAPSHGDTASSWQSSSHPGNLSSPYGDPRYPGSINPNISHPHGHNQLHIMASPGARTSEENHYIAGSYHPQLVAMGGVDPPGLRSVREFEEADVHQEGVEPPRYSEIFQACKGGWRLEEQWRRTVGTPEFSQLSSWPQQLT